MNNNNHRAESATANAVPTTAKTVKTKMEVAICAYPGHPGRYVIVDSKTGIIKEDAQSHGYRSIERATGAANYRGWEVIDTLSSDLVPIRESTPDCTGQRTEDNTEAPKVPDITSFPTLPVIKGVVRISPYLSHPGRYVIIDPATKEILADCQTHGFSSYQKAINFANQHKWVVMLDNNHAINK